MRLLIGAVFLLGFRSEQDRSKLDPPLRRLSEDPSAANRTIRAVIRLVPGRALPELPGVTFGSRAGDIATVTATVGALQALVADADVAEVLHERQFRPLSNLSLATTVGARGDISSSGETDVFTFAGVGGQTAVIRVHAESSSLNADVIASDTAATGGDGGPGNDAELTVTWLSTGSKTITVSGASSTTGTYVLFITINGDAKASDLSGSEITASNPAFVAGARVREARSTFGVDGSGVAIGIVDTGIDHKHQDFRGASGNTRLLAIWDQTLNPVTGESSPDVGSDASTTNDYGVEYLESHINNDLSGATPGFVRQKDTDGHGTHVAGIAAGDDTTFTGAAPGARLVVVKTGFKESQVIDAVNYVFSTASRLGYDGVVINLSLGDHDGPHDGTGALDQAIDAVADRGHYVVVAAGNDGDPTGSNVFIHAQASVAPSGSVPWTFTPTATSEYGVNSPHVVDIWANSSDQYSVTVTDTTNPSATATAASGATGTYGPNLLTASDKEYIVISNRTDSPSNGATHIRVEIQDKNVALHPYSVQLTRTVNAGNGVVDAYVGGATGKLNTAGTAALSDGSVSGTISEPGTARKVITVGAYRTKFAWDPPSGGATRKSDGIGYASGSPIPGQIAKFSSRGPTRDGRSKPDVAAPGAYLAGAKSTDTSPATADNDADGIHTYLQGTSVSAPVVAGILALLLQRNRLLTPEELRERFSSSQTDGMMSLTVAHAFGSGKADAVSVVGAVPIQKDVKAEGTRCLGSAPYTGFEEWWLLPLLAGLILRRRRIWTLLLIFAFAVPSVASDEEDVRFFARAHGGAWLSSSFDFEAIRTDGRREVDAQALWLAGADLGVRLFENYPVFATGEYAIGGDLSVMTLGLGAGYTYHIDDFIGPWPPSEFTFYAGGLWGRLEVDQEDFGKFDDGFGFRVGGEVSFHPSDILFADLFLEYRYLAFEYGEPIASGEEKIGGSAVVFGLGFELRL